MRKIQKTISLEPMTSRMPSVWPAYKDNTLYYFDNESLKARDYEYPSNYGMIPLQLSFTSSIDENENVEYSLSCEGDATTISFERLNDWYHFFKEYYHLLNDYGHCNRVYSSATEYYYYESGARYANQMMYGTDEQTYKDIDAKFEELGGKVEISVSGATDAGFYKWICNNIIPCYYISKEYANYWKRTKLYYPDVVKWISWFSERGLYERTYTATTYDDKGEIIEREHWDCKQDDFDCCDCEEYFNRGGKRELDRMMEWYNGLQDNITAMNETIRENIDCFIPTMDDKIQLYNSLDDLGQYSIFSKEYELGIDYRTANYGDTENTHGGTVAEISGRTMILNEGKNGFCFSPYYMEKIYDETAWSDYTEKYMGDSLCPNCGYYGEIGDTCPNCGYEGDFIRNRDEFVSNTYKFYAFDENNVMYTGQDEEEVEEKMKRAYLYDIIPTDSVLIGGTLYTIEHSEYGVYDPNNKYIGGKTFFVYRENDTSTPYTLLNGKKIYAEWYPYPNPSFNDQPCYYFTFFKNDDLAKRNAKCGIIENNFNITDYKPFGRKISTTEGDVIDYISYMGQIFQVTGDTLYIDELEYYRVFGYAYSKDNELMYCINVKNEEDEVIKTVTDEFLQEIPNSSIEDNTIVVGLDYEPTIYSATEISGHTLSRLTDLASTNLLIDDIGNEIDGRYNPNKVDTYNQQPPQGKELDLLYEVGNTSSIKRFRLTKSANTEVVDDEIAEIEINYFIGNIITDMVFYYKDVNGNVAESTITIDDEETIITTRVPWETSSLEAIHKSQTARTELENAGMIFDGDDIYCDITYHIGATLSRKQGESFRLAEDDDKCKYNHGIEYWETVKFVKENREYYLKKMEGKQIPTTFNSPSAHSISYPIYVYSLKQEMVDVETDTYDTYSQSPLASFKSEINLVNDDLTSNFGEYCDISNKIDVSPIFKDEYMLGFSSLENIESNIYIERGINAAFERHLKLGEVTSLEALEQYSNGYFKIMNNE